MTKIQENRHTVTIVFMIIYLDVQILAVIGIVAFIRELSYL